MEFFFLLLFSSRLQKIVAKKITLCIVYHSIDDVMGDEDEEEESDAIVNQVLDELGLQLNDKLGDAPVGQGTLATAGPSKNKTAVAAGAATTDDDADLQARLDDLRRD